MWLVDKQTRHKKYLLPLEDEWEEESDGSRRKPLARFINSVRLGDASWAELPSVFTGNEPNFGRIATRFYDKAASVNALGGLAVHSCAAITRVDAI